jgi:hypothetical protein
MTPHIIIFLTGLFFGSFLGIAIMCLCFIARSNDDDRL